MMIREHISFLPAPIINILSAELFLGKPQEPSLECCPSFKTNRLEVMQLTELCFAGRHWLDPSNWIIITLLPNASGVPECPLEDSVSSFITWITGKYHIQPMLGKSSTHTFSMNAKPHGRGCFIAALHSEFIYNNSTAHSFEE